MRWTEIYPPSTAPPPPPVSAPISRVEIPIASSGSGCQTGWLESRRWEAGGTWEELQQRAAKPAGGAASETAAPCLFNGANASLLPEFVALGLLYISPPTGSAARPAESRFRSSDTRNSSYPKNLCADIWCVQRPSWLLALICYSCVAHGDPVAWHETGRGRGGS